MATEDILIRYRADVSQLESDIDKVIKQQEELVKATNDNTTATNKAVTTQQFALKKRAELLEAEVKKLNQLKEAQKLAFDPKQIEKYNSQISESQKRIDLLSDKVEKSKGILASFSREAIDQFKALGLAAAGVFSVQSIVSFSQAAFNAFLDAEKAAEKLKFAIIDIGGESEQAYDKLIKQSEELQAITIFGDDDIQNAQAALANFNLTAAEIEGLIPKLLDFATVAGTDLPGAVSQIGAGLEGAGREFKKFGIEVDAAKSRQENLNIILQGFTKFAGAAANATNTVSGELQQQRNLVNNLQEQIGEKLAPAFLKIQTFALKASGVVADLFGVKTQTAVQKTTQQLREQQSEFNILSDTLKKTNISQETRANLIAEINSKYGEYLPKLLTEKSSLEDIEAAQKAVNKQIEGRVLLVALEDRIAKALENAAAGQAIVTKNTKELTAAQKDLGDNAAAVANKVNFANAAIGLGEGLIQGTQESIESIKQEYEDLKKQLGIVTDSTDDNTDANNKNAKSIEDQKKAAEDFKKLLESLDAEIKKVTDDLEKRKIEVIPADSQKAQEERIKALADLNEKAISDEIAAKVKLVQDDATLSEKQKQQAIAKYEELKAARLALAQFNEQNELNIISAAQIDRIEAAAKQLDDLGIQQALTIEADKVEAANEAVAKSFEDLGEAVSKADFEAAKEAATARTAALNQALKNEQAILETSINNNREAELAKVKEGEGAAAEREVINKKADDQILTATKNTNDAIAKNNKELNDNININTERSTEARIAQTFEILDATKQLFSELSAIYDQFSEQRIGQIEAERDAQLESIDAQIEQNAEYLENRRISEEEAAANEKALQEEKVRIEAAAQKKIREEKRKQAILDKAAAAFEIGLATAVAIVAAQKQPPPLNAILTAIIATTSALQLAAVAAQPIPYRKGSKNTGSNEHLARVGEEGEELVWMPANSKVLPARQTKKYSEIIDAMYDNKLDDYVYKNYITPALMAQKEAKENQRAKSFAENMASSIVYNQAGLTPSDLEAQRKRGQYIRNVDEIADAIARKLPIRDIYRA